MKIRVVVSAVLLAVLMTCPALSATNESYIIGTVTNGMYMNKNLGVKAYFGENWKILSREEIAEICGAVSSISPAFEEATKGEVPSFYVITKDGTANINITITNLGVMGSAYLSQSDEFAEELANFSSANLSKAYTEMGYKNIAIKRAKTKLAGKQYSGLAISAAVHGVNMYQKQAYCIKGEYAYCVTATSFGLDITGKLLGMFIRLYSR